jgi:hypothetical protein
MHRLLECGAPVSSLKPMFWKNSRCEDVVGGKVGGQGGGERLATMVTTMIPWPNWTGVGWMDWGRRVVLLPVIV